LCGYRKTAHGAEGVGSDVIHAPNWIRIVRYELADWGWSVIRPTRSSEAWLLWMTLLATGSRISELGGLPWHSLKV
jgi:hypothetical protein